MSDVHLYVYDLSKGLASQLAHMFIGRHLDGIWHTAVVAFGREWFFGGSGIEDCAPKGTHLGEPLRVVHLGRTEISRSDFVQIINQLKQKTFRIGSYDIFKHNCNNFSNHLAQFLVGTTIPSYITDLPNEVLKTPFGAMIANMMNAPVIMHQGTPAATVQETIATDECRNEAMGYITEPVKFEHKIENELKDLCENSDLKLSEDDRFLANELKAYFEQAKIEWSISAQHIKLLYKLLDKDHEYLEQVLKIMQIISLDKYINNLLKCEDAIFMIIIPKMKTLQNENLIESHFRWFTNIAVHDDMNEWLWKNRDTIFSHLVDFLTHANGKVSDTCLLFYYNLICTFEGGNKMLTDSNGLSLGVALVHLIQNGQITKDTTFHVLSLLEVCCKHSNDLLEYIQSLDGLNLQQFSDDKTKLIIDNIIKLIAQGP